jgi:hypothetical protein
MEDQRHLEQNPDTKSLGKLRDRKETMQFLERGKDVAVVADGRWVESWFSVFQPRLEALILGTGTQVRNLDGIVAVRTL